LSCEYIELHLSLSWTDGPSPRAAGAARGARRPGRAQRARQQRIYICKREEVDRQSAQCSDGRWTKHQPNRMDTKNSTGANGGRRGGTGPHTVSRQQGSQHISSQLCYRLSTPPPQPHPQPNRELILNNLTYIYIIIIICI